MIYLSQQILTTTDNNDNFLWRDKGMKFVSNLGHLNYKFNGNIDKSVLWKLKHLFLYNNLSILHLSLTDIVCNKCINKNT